MRLLLLMIVLLAAAQPALCASATPGAKATHEHSPGPVMSSDAQWCGAVVIGIAAMFIAAAVIGPVYRASMPDEPPPADDPGHDAHGHGHDAHGHDQSHGSGGH